MMKKIFYKSIFLAFLILCGNISYAANQDVLLTSERNTIEIFQKNSPKVIFVNRLKTIMSDVEESFQVPSGAGTGIIWDKEGHIVTNFHVINGADKLSVSIGKQTFSAKVIGSEPRKDIAVLALNPKALPLLTNFEPFVIANSSDLLVGQKTIAIGNPYGLDHSLTTGVISALGRQVPGIAGVKIRNMIQTDASINPGNSGGPLLDSHGRLIGLNTMIFSQSGASAGVGFAVPADEISRNVSQIIKNGRVSLSGIGIQPIRSQLAEGLGIDKGVLIAEVLPKTPAERAGLKPTHRDSWGRIKLGDIITALNGTTIENYDGLYNSLSQIPIGKSVTLTIKRDGKKITKTIKTIDISRL